MRGYKRLKAWKAAEELCLATLEAADAVRYPKGAAVLDQLRRAVVSVVANIVEGYALGSVAQFRRHLRIALGSAAETECLLELAEKRSYLPKPTVKTLLNLANNAIGTLYGLIRSPRLTVPGP